MFRQYHGFIRYIHVWRLGVYWGEYVSKKLAVIGLSVAILAVYMWHDRIFGLLVIAPPGFEISAATETIMLSRYEGSSNSTTVTIRSVNGFQGTVTIEVALESPFTIGVVEPNHPPNLTLAAYEQASFELTFFVRSTISPGTKLVDVTATDGKIEVSVTVTLIVSS